MQALAGTPGHYGAPGHDVALAEVITSTCWTVQGDAARAAFATECERRFDLELPRAPNTTARSVGWTALWLGPRSWLLIRDPHRDPLSLDASLGARDALNAQGGALFDTSASRVAFAVSGASSATVLAKSCPVDLHASVFSGGSCAQTLLGHVNSLLYRPDSTTTIIAMVARSFARDAWHTLCASAAQYGYDVTPPVVFGDGVAGEAAPIRLQGP
jgi:heterotetrameric sarcosine oxidase gamma subunit